MIKEIIDVILQTEVTITGGVLPMLTIWLLFGMLVGSQFKEPKNCRDLCVQLFAQGPIAWIIAIVICLVHFTKRRLSSIRRLYNG